MEVIQHENEYYIGNSKQYFVRGTGWKDVRKSQIKNIPDLKYNGRKNSFIEIAKWLKNNEDYAVNYIREYGLNITLEQLGCANEQDWGKFKSFTMVKHFQKFGIEHIKYILETNDVLIELYKAVSDNVQKIKRSVMAQVIVEDALKRDPDSLIVYDWILQTWSINITNYMSTRKSDFETLVYSLDNNNELSMKEALNCMKKGLGEKTERCLTYTFF